MQKHLRPGSFQLSIHIRAHFDYLSGGFQKKSPTRWSLEHCRVFFYFKDIKLCSFVNVPDKERVKRIWEHTCTVLVLRMAHRKGKEIKQQPSMLPGPAVPGSCLVSFHFLWAILSTSTVIYSLNEWANLGVCFVNIQRFWSKMYYCATVWSSYILYDHTFRVGCHEDGHSGFSPEK